MGHTAADNQGITFFQKIGNNIQFIRNLGAAENGDKRAYRGIYGISKEINFFLHQITDSAGIHIFGHADIGTVGAVCRSKSIIDKDIT